MIVQFNSHEELIRFLELIKDKGWVNFMLKVKGEDRVYLEDMKKKQLNTEEPTSSPVQKKWKGVGSIDSEGRLDSIPNLRDFAYDE